MDAEPERVAHGLVAGRANLLLDEVDHAALKLVNLLEACRAPRSGGIALGFQRVPEAKLAKKVREGGSGVWGQVPMPPNTTVTEKDALALVKWILAQK